MDSHRKSTLGSQFNMATKRPHRALSLSEKVSLIDAVEQNPGKKRKLIAEEFGIPPPTLTNILKDRHKFKAAHRNSTPNSTKARLRQPKHEDIDQALLNWFSRTRSANVPVTGPLLRQKADEIAVTMGHTDWKCCDSWVSRFKARHDIVMKTMSGERNSVDEAGADNWIVNVLQPILSSYKARDVFNADESGLYWRLLPNKTLAFRKERCFGGKRSKERITFLTCCNMDGTEKMPMYTIWKFKKPRCFSGITCLPVQYEASEKAWMTSALFSTWLANFDKNMNAQKRKVLVVVNCSSHEKNQSPLKATELFLPTNATAKLQPTDQGIIKNIKVHYRTALLSKYIDHVDAGLPKETFSGGTLLDALTLLKQSWERVIAETISNCFRKAFTLPEPSSSRSHSHTSEEEPMAVEPLLSRLHTDFNITPDDFFDVDADVAVSDLTQAVSDPLPPEAADIADSDSDDDSSEPAAKVTRQEICECVRKLNLYCMQIGASADVLLQPVSMMNRAVNTHLTQNKVQSTIFQFFRPKRSDGQRPSDTPEPKLKGESSELDEVKGKTWDYNQQWEEQAGEEDEETTSTKLTRRMCVEEIALEEDPETETDTGEDSQNEDEETQRKESEKDITEETQHWREETGGVDEEKRNEKETEPKGDNEKQKNTCEKEGKDEQFPTKEREEKNREGNLKEKQEASEDDGKTAGGNECDVKIVSYEEAKDQMFVPTNEDRRQRKCIDFGLPHPRSMPERNTVPLGKLLQVDNIVGDGNCLYRAISLEICGTQEKHKDIREIIVDFMLKHPTPFPDTLGLIYKNT